MIGQTLEWAVKSFFERSFFFCADNCDYGNQKLCVAFD